MARNVIDLFTRRKSPGREPALQAANELVRACQHCHEQHTEDYLCPELLYAHGLPSRVAGRQIQNHAR